MIFSVKVAGIEFSGDEARVAVMKTGGRTPTVLELVSCRAEYEDPEDRFQAMVSALDMALSRLNNTPAVYVLCSSARYAVVRPISIPLQGRRRGAAAVPASGSRPRSTGAAGRVMGCGSESGREAGGPGADGRAARGLPDRTPRPATRQVADRGSS